MVIPGFQSGLSTESSPAHPGFSRSSSGFFLGQAIYFPHSPLLLPDYAIECDRKMFLKNALRCEKT